MDITTHNYKFQRSVSNPPLHNTQYSIALKQIYINELSQHIFQTPIHQIRDFSDRGSGHGNHVKYQKKGFEDKSSRGLNPPFWDQ